MKLKLEANLGSVQLLYRYMVLKVHLPGWITEGHGGGGNSRLTGSVVECDFVRGVVVPVLDLLYL